MEHRKTRIGILGLLSVFGPCLIRGPNSGWSSLPSFQGLAKYSAVLTSGLNETCVTACHYFATLPHHLK